MNGKTASPLLEPVFQGKDNHMIRRLNPGVTPGDDDLSLMDDGTDQNPGGSPKSRSFALVTGESVSGLLPRISASPDCKRLIWTILLFRTSLRTVFTVSSRGVMAAVTRRCQPREYNPPGRSRRSPLPRQVGVPEDWPSDYYSLSPGGKRRHLPVPNFALPKPPY